MFDIYYKTIALLTPHEKYRGMLVLVLVVFMALLETAGVASILPFLAVLGNPEVVETNPILSFLYSQLEFQTINGFLMALGCAAFGVIIFATGVRVLTTYAMSRYLNMRRHSLSDRLLETYLSQPYAFFLNRHSGDMAKSILSEVDQVIDNVLQPGYQIIAYTFVVLALITLVVIMDPWIALWVGLVFGGMYLFTYLSVRRLMGRIGRDRTDANRERFAAAGEALGGIKAIKLQGCEYSYLSRFRAASSRFARHRATAAITSELPKYVVEAISVGGILLLALYLMATTDGIGTVLPTLGVYAFAGYKLLPSAQKIYEGFARIRFGTSAVEEVYGDLCQRTRLAEIRSTPQKALTPTRGISLNQVSFTYLNAASPALRDIDLNIPVGETVGIVGTTGAGKTTLVDIILGLLRPTAGSLRIDGEPITEVNLGAWQHALGYVPQDIFLTDSSIAENIAFGVPPEQIDREAVLRCARMAQVHEFIMQELPQQYDALVGERGVRISGGQRQRIGIARALYHDPPILVFDEATSALDTLTEQGVMQAINNVRGEKTIIIIAHRLSTVRDCNCIYLLEKGRISGQGTYENMAMQNDQFRAMAIGQRQT